MENIVDHFISYQQQFRILHWQTKSFARHKAYGKFYDTFGDLMDKFIEKCNNGDITNDNCNLTSKILSKVKVSGGGRCNVTHDCKDVPHLLTKYPRGKNFLKKAFYQFATQQTIDWYAAHGVDLHVEGDGRMFPVSNNSETIIQCLLKNII